jgi:hypothetical protein
MKDQVVETQDLVHPSQPMSRELIMPNT